MEIGKYINHTNLNKDAKEKDIIKLCEEAINYNFESVCVHPYYVELAKDLLKDTNLEVSTVVGYPLGMSTPKSKAFEAVEAIELGADEIELSINIGALKDQDYNYVKKEIEEIRDNIEGKPLKIIVTPSVLTEKELIKITEICNETFINYIKINNDSKFDITVESLKTINKHKNELLEIEVAGDIKTYSTFNELIQAGAKRISTPFSVEIIKDKR